MGQMTCTCPVGFSGSICQNEVSCATFGIQQTWNGWEAILERDPTFVPGGDSLAQNDTLWITSGVDLGTQIGEFTFLGAQEMYQVNLTDSSILQSVYVPAGNTIEFLVQVPGFSNYLIAGIGFGVSNLTGFPGVNTSMVLKLDVVNNRVLINKTATDFIASAAWPLGFSGEVSLAGLAVLADGLSFFVLIENINAINIFDLSIEYLYTMRTSDFLILSVTLLPYSGPQFSIVVAGYAVYNASLYLGQVNGNIQQQLGFPPWTNITTQVLAPATINPVYRLNGMAVTPYNDVYTMFATNITNQLELNRYRFNITSNSNVAQLITASFMTLPFVPGAISVTPWNTVILMQETDPFVFLAACNCTNSSYTFFNTRCVPLCLPGPCEGGSLCVLNSTSPRGFSCECNSPYQVGPNCHPVPCTNITTSLAWTENPVVTLGIEQGAFTTNSSNIVWVNDVTPPNGTAILYKVQFPTGTLLNSPWSRLANTSAVSFMTADVRVPDTLHVGAELCQMSNTTQFVNCLQTFHVASGTSSPSLNASQLETLVPFCQSLNGTRGYTVYGVSQSNLTSTLFVTIGTPADTPFVFTGPCNCTSMDFQACVGRAYVFQLSVVPGQSTYNVITSVFLSNYPVNPLKQVSMFVIRGVEYMFFCESVDFELFFYPVANFFSDGGPGGVANFLAILDLRVVFNITDGITFPQIESFSFDPDGALIMYIQTVQEPDFGTVISTTIVTGQLYNTGLSAAINITQILPHSQYPTLVSATTARVQFASWGQMLVEESVPLVVPTTKAFTVLTCELQSPCVTNPCTPSNATCTPGIPANICD